MATKIKRPNFSCLKKSREMTVFASCTSPMTDYLATSLFVGEIDTFMKFSPLNRPSSGHHQPICETALREICPFAEIGLIVGTSPVMKLGSFVVSYTYLCPPPPPGPTLRRRKVYCFANVGRSVGRSVRRPNGFRSITSEMLWPRFHQTW